MTAYVPIHDTTYDDSVHTIKWHYRRWLCTYQYMTLQTMTVYVPIRDTTDDDSVHTSDTTDDDSVRTNTWRYRRWQCTYQYVTLAQKIHLVYKPPATTYNNTVLPTVPLASNYNKHVDVTSQLHSAVLQIRYSIRHSPWAHNKTFGLCPRLDICRWTNLLYVGNIFHCFLTINITDLPRRREQVWCVHSPEKKTEKKTP